VRKHLVPNDRVYDSLSALAVLRGWDARPGARVTLWTFGGMRLWRTTIVVDREEDIDTSLGRIRAVKLAATSVRMASNLAEDRSRPPRTWQVWLSRDAKRIPLLVKADMDIGQVAVRITSYEAR